MEQHAIINATFIWTFTDAKDRQKALLTSSTISKNRKMMPSWLSNGISILILLIVLLVVLNHQNISSLSQIRKSLPLIIAIALPIIVFCITFIYLQKQNFTRSFLQSPDSGKEVIDTITDDEIELKVANVYEMKWKWTSLIEVKRTPKGFCFLQAPQTGFWIPLHAFKSQIDINHVSEMASRLIPSYFATIE
jgi:uncharacterized integral membrane protein